MDDGQTDRLRNILDKLDEAKNQVSLEEFRMYIPLFRADAKLSEVTAKSLADKFIRRFNPYENIVIHDSAGDVLTTIPRIFTKVKDIDPKFNHLVSRFSRDAVSKVPKYSAEATRGLLLAIKHTHRDDAEYLKYVNSITAEYAAMVNPDAKGDAPPKEEPILWE